VGSEIIAARTIVLTAGIVPSAVASEMSVVRDQRGRIAVDATMRSRSHPSVWALGDCAAIPGPDGRPYPALAQHTVREARHLAPNIEAAIEQRLPTPFVFRPLGTMASLGHTRAVALVFGMRLTGFPAWGTSDVLPVSDAALGPPSAHRSRLDGCAVLPAGHHEGRAARRA
jgi:NADH dehydrogenase